MAYSELVKIRSPSGAASLSFWVKVVWSSHLLRDADGDEQTLVYLKFPFKVNKAFVYQTADHMYEKRLCGCMRDCCGCWFARVGRVRRHNARTWAVPIWSARNF